MPYTAVVSFVGYREWTESLGPDREWLIQVVQSRLYEVIQSFSKDLDGVALPLRYDVQVVLLPASVDVWGFVRGLKAAVEPYSPTPVAVRVCYGNPARALSRCGRELSEDYIEYCSNCEDALAVAHADLNFFSRLTEEGGFYTAYVNIVKYLAGLAEVLNGKAVVQYLGGDNLVAVTSEDLLGDVLEALTSRDGVKVGVGVSPVPKKAFERATDALTQLRAEGRVRKYLVVRG